jgi:hypothetical protein
MRLAVVAAPLPLRPDPDENSPPVVTLDPSDVLTVVLALGSWSKVSLTRSGEAFQGWVTSDSLIEFQAATVQLFDEPLGVARGTATGRIEIITTVATWSKVKVTKADGSVLVAWTEAAPARPSSPADTGMICLLGSTNDIARHCWKPRRSPESARPRSPR